MNKKIDLSWGDSVSVRQAFLETAGNKPIIFSPETLGNMGYPDHFGDPALVELTRKIIKRQVGNDYKYIVITNGATGGVTIALRAFKMRGAYQCWTADPPYFRLYPDMIESAGLVQVRAGEDKDEIPYNPVYLIDMPSNPLGILHEAPYRLTPGPVVLDTVYLNRVYCNESLIATVKKPKHDVLVGSYSKFTGLNGLRVGWIATNDGLLYERLRTLVESEYCGISAASTKIIMETAGKFTVGDWYKFEYNATLKLDNNRGEWSKLERYFGGTYPLPYGMFMYCPLDKQAKKLLNKSNIIWSTGSSLGTTDDFGRFNLGQDNDLVNKAVKEILKNDKIK
jgi:aspartate/methionine/tyrosine aminotransferase